MILNKEAAITGNTPFASTLKNYAIYFNAPFILFVPLNNGVKQAQLGVPHSRIQVEVDFILQAGTCQILNFA